MPSRYHALEWYMERIGRITYSQEHRLGPFSYDGPAALYAALIVGGFLSADTPLGDLSDLYLYEGQLLQPIRYHNIQKGDVFLSAQGEEVAHAGMVLDRFTVIQCSEALGGINRSPIYGYVGPKPTHWYRLALPHQVRVNQVFRHFFDESSGDLANEPN